MLFSFCLAMVSVASIFLLALRFPHVLRTIHTVKTVRSWGLSVHLYDLFRMIDIFIYAYTGIDQHTSLRCMMMMMAVPVVHRSSLTRCTYMQLFLRLILCSLSGWKCFWCGPRLRTAEEEEEEAFL